MRSRIRSAAAPLAVCALALCTSVSTASGGGGEPAATEGGPAPLLQLYALEADLQRAQSRLAGIRADRDGLVRERATAELRLQVLRETLQASRKRLSAVLRTAYENGGTEPLAVLLGATSLDEAVDGIEELSRAAAQTRSAIAQVARSRAAIADVLPRLEARSRALSELERQARASVVSLESTLVQRRAYVASLGSGAAGPAASLSAAEQEAREAGRRSVAVEAQPVRPVRIPGTLTLDAVAYSLPGRTASGLPVGSGVVAVDPTIIPLGTSMYVPGYGEAVAADVGTAVKGLVIDLWFATLAEARAWGRRTVTVTLR